MGLRANTGLHWIAPGLLLCTLCLTPALHEAQARDLAGSISLEQAVAAIQASDFAEVDLEALLAYPLVVAGAWRDSTGPGFDARLPSLPAWFIPAWWTTAGPAFAASGA